MLTFRRRRARLAAIGLLAVLAGSLGGCERRTVQRTPEQLEHMKLKRMNPSHADSIGPVVRGFGTEEGVAEVVDVDRAARTVTLRHRQTSGGDWPGMVMTFRAQPVVLGQASVGQQVRFRARLRDGAGEIVELRAASPE